MEDVFFGFGDCFEDFGGDAEVFGEDGFGGMGWGECVLVWVDIVGGV